MMGRPQNVQPLCVQIWTVVVQHVLFGDRVSSFELCAKADGGQFNPRIFFAVTISTSLLEKLMEKPTLNTPETNQSTDTPTGRWGLWVPTVLATIGAGVLLSGLFARSTGLFGDAMLIEFSDMFAESGKIAVRLVIFSLLLLGAFRINSWRLQQSLGDLKLAALRCLAVVVLVEAVRVTPMQPGLIRVVFIGAAQYMVFTIGVFTLFVFTIKEAVLFGVGCTIGVVVLWLGSQLGTWIA